MSWTPAGLSCAAIGRGGGRARVRGVDDDQLGVHLVHLQHVLVVQAPVLAHLPAPEHAQPLFPPSLCPLTYDRACVHGQVSIGAPDPVMFVLQDAGACPPVHAHSLFRP